MCRLDIYCRGSIADTRRGERGAGGTRDVVGPATELTTSGQGTRADGGVVMEQSRRGTGPDVHAETHCPQNSDAKVPLISSGKGSGGY